MKIARLGLFLTLLGLSACQNENQPIKLDQDLDQTNVDGGDTPNDVDNEGPFTPKVIYGVDNRLDLYQVDNANLLQLADSTVALFRSEKIEPRGDGSSNIKGDNFATRYGLCPEEPFGNQEMAAFCSGSLIGEDLILTAGHCITSQSSCLNTRFAFGYAIHEEGTLPKVLPDDQIYQCAELIYREVNQNGSDFALVRLSQKVLDHQPLMIRTSGKIDLGQEVLVIGHPVGLPTKVTTSGFVRSQTATFFVANLDTYGGNSGSAVFNADTGVIEGILVRGEVDFVSRNGCMISNVCAEDGCRGEDVTNVTRILAHLPDGAGSQSSMEFSNDTAESIPDNSKKGTSSTIAIPQSPKGRTVKITVNIQHTWIGDLVLTLAAPDGRKFVLHNRQGGSSDNIVGTFGTELTSQTDLSTLSQIEESGNWVLTVQDLARQDVGTLRSWSIRLE